MNLDLRDLPPWLIAGISLGSAIGLILFGWLRDRFGRDFARAADVGALATRMQAVETRIATMPDHRDIHALTARVAAVEGGIGVVTEKARGIEASLKRVEHAVDLLVQHQINRTDA